MEPHNSQYVIDQIPDRYFPRYQLVAGGDVVSAVNDASAHLLRTLVQFPPESVTMGIRFVFRPDNQGDRRQRLSIQTDISAKDEQTHEMARVLLNSGPLASFYTFGPSVSGFDGWSRMGAAVDIVRYEFALSPLIAETNVEAFDRYYLIDSFEAVEDNDYMQLDEVLGKQIHEPVVVDMRVAPAAIDNERDEHTKYLARLQRINRHWNRGGDIGFMADMDREFDSSMFASRTKALEPLREDEPVADLVLRHQQRFHEKLQRPHLMFSPAGHGRN